MQTQYVMAEHVHSIPVIIYYHFTTSMIRILNSNDLRIKFYISKRKNANFPL